ncbi:MAG: 7-cyano-7-deazaguanine synthase QueC [Candidatus Omnitrophota bacterium]
MVRAEEGLSAGRQACLPSRQAVVLLSGGLDSATTLYLVRKKGFRPTCLVFDYGQRHKKEMNSARRLARRVGCSAHVLKIQLPWKGSSLLDRGQNIPESAKSGRRIPSTYVPGRNTIFLSFALSFAEAIGARDIFIGANALDYSGYPDCRPEYFKAFNRLSFLATKCGVEHRPIRIHAPLVDLKKSQIIVLGTKLGVPYELTWSCYQGGRKPCGCCESCALRAKGFSEADLPDPLLS